MSNTMPPRMSETVLRKAALRTISHPAEAAREVLSWRFGMSTLIEAAMAVSCLGVLLSIIAATVYAVPLDAYSQYILANPLAGAVIQFVLLLAMAAGIWFFGRMFGGQGSGQDALMSVVWLNGLMLPLQLAQITFLILLPPLAVLLTLVVSVWLLWAATHFVACQHGFQNLRSVFFAMIGIGFGVMMSVAMILLGLGLIPEG